MIPTETPLNDVALSKHCTALLGRQRGKYPDANAMVVRGNDQTALIDLSLGVAARRDAGQSAGLANVDLVLLSHCHEDHFVDLGAYPKAEVWVHQSEKICLRSLDHLLDMFGVTGRWREETARGCIEKFKYAPRPDAIGFTDGQVWDLGGVTVTAIHAPGHTPGHCLFHVQPDNILFLADIDLSSFGPFYADVESSIDDFQRSIEIAKQIRADHYVTGHHKGVVDREAFDALIAAYAKVIPRREQRLLDYLTQPRTLDQIVEHRFIYRPGDIIPGGDWIERAGMRLHLDRLLQQARITRRADQSYQACSGQM